MELKVIVGILVGAVISGAVGLIYSRLFKGSDARRAAREDEIIVDRKRMTQMEKQIEILTAEAKPIAGFVLALATSKLTHMHYPKADKLLSKVNDKEKLSDSEIDTLADALKERIVTLDGTIDEEERIWATIYPGLVKLEKLESERIAKGEQGPTETALVSAPIPDDPAAQVEAKK